MRWADHMEDETSKMLCLVRHFDNREIREAGLWGSAVVPEVKAFVGQMMPGCSYCLLLDAHISICFAAGYFLPLKSGIDVSVMQSTHAKRLVWTPQPFDASEARENWTITEERTGSPGSEVAVAVSVTHDVAADVRAYVAAKLPKVGTILRFSVLPQSGPTAIRDVKHALALAQGLSSSLRSERTGEERKLPVHLFLSAPAGFVFFLGRLAPSFGSVVVYEYDFETNAPGAYQAGIRLPAKSA